MASLLKASEKIQKGKKRAAEDEAGPSTVVEKKRKDKVLMLSSRGVTGRMRHLMADIESLLPHVKKGECGMLRR
jgi:ribosome biogenesis protein BRX1